MEGVITHCTFCGATDCHLMRVLEYPRAWRCRICGTEYYTETLARKEAKRGSTYNNKLSQS